MSRRSLPARHCLIPLPDKMGARSDASIEALIAGEKLPASYHVLVDRAWRPLALQIADWRRDAGRAIIVGVNGGQGSGKTTLCMFLEQALLPEVGWRAVTVSLDDFYLPKADRIALGEKIHPLLATRGVPGTHDVPAMMRALATLSSGEEARLPFFDKAVDDCAPPDAWWEVEGGADVILFEGWCVGAVAQNAKELAAPINTLERDEDENGVWRQYVNDRLGADYGALFALIDHLVMLRAPNMDSIIANRREQERKLREARPDGASVMSDAEVSRFVQHYERLTRHMLAEMPDRAEAVFDLEVLRALQGA